MADEENLPAKAGISAGALIPQDLLEELSGEATGAGVSTSSEDNIIPFLSLLQSNSPEIKRRDPKYVEGAEEGYLLNKATRQIWSPENGPTVIPCAFVRVINEWIPRDDGGGFVGRHPFINSVDESMAAIGAKQVRDPKDPDKTVWMTGDGRRQLIDTRYHYVLIELEDGSKSPAVISFSSTGHTTSRAWMSLMNVNIPGTVKKADSWMRRYKLRTVPKKNKKGDFFVVVVDQVPGIEGWVKNKEDREYAAEFHKSVMSGAVRAADEERGAGAPVGDELPI